MKFYRIVLVFILFGSLMAVSGCKDRKTEKESAPKIPGATVSRKLAVVPPAFFSSKQDNIRQESHSEVVIFSASGTSVAYVEPVDSKFRVVHNGKAGQPYNAISELIVSGNGNRVAYVGLMDDETFRMVVDGREELEFGPDSNHWFTPDGRHYVATVGEGKEKYIAIDNKINRDYAVSRGPVVGFDSNSMAFSVQDTEGKGWRFIISSIDFENVTVFDSCGTFILPNEEISRVAIGCIHDGRQSVKVIDLVERTVLSESMFKGTITRMSFLPGGRSVLYTTMTKDYQRSIVYGDRVEKTPAGEEFMTNPVALSEPESAGVVIGNVYKVHFYRAFRKDHETGKDYGYVSDLVASDDGLHYAYIATDIEAQQMEIVVDGHEGPKFDKIVSPVFSPDGDLLVYRARQSGKRFVVVSDLKGKIIKKHPEYDLVFPVSFSEDGKSVKYGVLDGNELWWKVEKL